MLSERLAAVADTQEDAMRDRLHAALRVGAEMALARIDEVGGKYATGGDIRTVRDELDAEAKPSYIAYEGDVPPLIVKTPETEGGMAVGRDPRV